MTDAIQKRLTAATKLKWKDEDVYLRKLGADQTLKFVSAVQQRKANPMSLDEDRQATMDLHADNISKSFANESGALLYDSAEGLAKLKQLPFDELVELGDLVLSHSGFGGEKKTSQPSNDSLSDCAANSEAQTAPTPTTSSAA